MATDDDKSTPPPHDILLVGALVLVLGVGAYLTLVLTGNAGETDKLLGFLSPVIAAIFIVGYQKRQHAVTEERLDQQDKQLVTITKQTNGVLDQKIQDNTEKAFVESQAIADSIRANTRDALRDMLAEHLDEPPQA